MARERAIPSELPSWNPLVACLDLPVWSSCPSPFSWAPCTFRQVMLDVSSFSSQSQAHKQIILMSERQPPLHTPAPLSSKHLPHVPAPPHVTVLSSQTNKLRFITHLNNSTIQTILKINWGAKGNGSLSLYNVFLKSTKKPNPS